MGFFKIMKLSFFWILFLVSNRWCVCEYFFVIEYILGIVVVDLENLVLEDRIIEFRVEKEL